MYAADVKGERLNLAVSGMLWRRSLIMRDEETGTLWSHLLGKGMRGKHEGVQLEVLPSSLTDWKTWKAQHPETSVLAMSRTARGFVTEMQRAPGRFVLGLREGGVVRAYPYDRLKEEVVVNDEVGEKRIVVTYEAAAATARVFSAAGKWGVLVFEKAGVGLMRDVGTGSLWNLATGECREGELKGVWLEEAVGIPSYKKAWEVFYPQGETYGGKG